MGRREKLVGVDVDQRWIEEWSAFWELHVERVVPGESDRAISHAAILAWLQLHDVARWRWDWFATVLRAMDRHWLHGGTHARSTEPVD